MPFLTHNTLHLTERTISIERLPDVFNGFRIVQLSDLHFYEYTNPDYYQRVTGLVNQLEADILVVTGDVIHQGSHHVYKAEAFLKQLNARHGKLAILGNHDYQDDDWGQNIVNMHANAGLTLLTNQKFLVERDGFRLWFTGLDDLYYGKPDIKAALEGIPTHSEVTIMLAHNPLLFDPVALGQQGQVDLVISGHTHAGHVYIPFLEEVYRRVFRMKYRYGLFKKQNCQLHVTSGVGSAAFYMKKLGMGFPRFRFNTHPEVVLLTLSNES